MRATAAAAIAALLALAPTGARATTYFTDFEFGFANPPFVLGTTPGRATFTGGSSQLSSFSLYRSGLYSWLINKGGTGTIAFETPPRAVTLYFKDDSAGVESLLTITDQDGTDLAGVVGTNAGTDLVQFTKVEVSVEPGDPLIETVTLANTTPDGVPFPVTVIDDLTWVVEREAVCAVDLGDQIKRGVDGGLAAAVACLLGLTTL